MNEKTLNDKQLLRYSRHIMLPQLDYVGQQKILRAKVLVVGLGGLGSPVAMYLAASGVGTLILNDFDTVDLGNLQRQIVHNTASLDVNKAVSARQTLEALNPDCHIVEISKRLDAVALREQIHRVDVVVDCSDNFDTRFLLNQLCHAEQTPLISGAAIRFEGQLTVFYYQNAEDACYRCLYKDVGEEEETCAVNGILAPVVGVIGSLQALETIKVIAGLGETLRNRLMIFDGYTQQVRVVNYKKDPQCPVCG